MGDRKEKMKETMNSSSAEQHVESDGKCETLETLAAEHD